MENGVGVLEVRVMIDWMTDCEVWGYPPNLCVPALRDEPLLVRLMAQCGYD
jgi:hypothetical protein